MKTYFLLILLIVFHDSFAQESSCKSYVIQPSEINEKISVDKLYQDIDEFIQIIEEVHVNPYMKISKEEFYDAADKLKNSIDDSLTRQQFYQVLTPLVDMLNDSHTGVKFPKTIWKHYQYEANGLFFPMEIATTMDKRIFIKRDFSENKIPDNTEILSINSIKSEDIINTFLKYDPSPIEISSIKRLEKKFPDYMWWVLDFRGPYIVETNAGTFTVQGQIWNEYYRNKKAFEQKQKTTKEKISLVEIDNQTCMLKITSFSGSTSDFKPKIEEQFRLIQEKRYKNLIIDVRDNGGGNDDNGKAVIDYITDKPYSIGLASKFMMKRSKRYEKYQKCKAPWIFRWMINLRTVSWFNKEYRLLFKNLRKIPYGENLDVKLPLQEPTENTHRFKGKVYALSSQYSYSATTAFLGAFKDYKLGEIIGTETGDCPTGFGNNLYFQLQNSKLRCHSSTTFIVRPNGNIDMTHGVIPDYRVEQTIEDTEKNEDTILNLTLELIEKTKHNKIGFKKQLSPKYRQ
jgi:hypothetical protein